MNKIDLQTLLNEKENFRFITKSNIISKIIFKIIKKVLYIDKINDFIHKHEHLDAKHFIMEIFDFLNYSFLITDNDIQKIPSQGRVICVANHPSSLDSLIILKALLDVRSDVKIVANDLILQFDFLKDHIIPVDIFHNSFQRKNLELIGQALENENAVIIFPAGEVSRLKWFRIRDSKWKNGAIHYAQKFNSPILPIFIFAKNSLLFYLTSLLNKNLSMILLAHEIFNKKNKTARVIFGDLISSKTIINSNVNIIYKVKLLRKHVYHIGKNRKKIFSTEKNVIHPTNKKLLKQELSKSCFIGTTSDGKKIFLTTKNDAPNTLNEIARLRELTFRKVGEGTGNKLDLDKYDSYYHHLVVWDEEELEIVGSYRLGIGKDILNKFGQTGFYTSTLFNYNKSFIDEIIPYSVELGRSFVQEKYWNTYALDYLWQGIGSFLNANPGVKYLFGPVSISSNYPKHIIALIVYYFKKWYSNSNNYASSVVKFNMKEKYKDELLHTFFGTSAKDDYKILKKMLSLHGFSVPILYKHYSELCYDNGVSFLDFSVDPSFMNCVDGLILVDISKIKTEKKLRYLKTKIQSELQPADV
ncbi:MAG: GNAT family N-acetyltransferase [Ignavibacteriaceae bacterium]|nr:GNAT family N-acetyltransferase [Ignavibacteriaceae bacterium]